MRILVTGASGQLGAYLLREALRLNHTPTAWSGTQTGQRGNTELQPVDLLDDDVTARAFDTAQPDAVIHAAALARVGDAYHNPDRARAVNATATESLANLCAQRAIPFVHCSTDMVFDGQRGTYTETDTPSPSPPSSVYAQTKLKGEHATLNTPRGTVCRLALLFGPSLHNAPTFYDGMLDRLRTGRPVTLFDDEWRTPLALDDAARALVIACEDPQPGLFHLGGPERLSRHEMGLEIARRLGVDEALCEPVSRLSFASPEPRQRDLSLDSAKAVARWGDGWRPPYTKSVARMLSAIDAV